MCSKSIRIRRCQSVRGRDKIFPPIISLSNESRRQGCISQITRDPPHASHGPIDRSILFAEVGILHYVKLNDLVQVNSPKSIALTCRKCAQWTSMSTTSLSIWWLRSKLSFYRFKPALKTYFRIIWAMGGDSNYFLNLFLGNFTHAAQHPRHFWCYGDH